MSGLVDKIPDVSSEEVDDIDLINYTQSVETERICEEAKIRLLAISSSRLKTVGRDGPSVEKTQSTESLTVAKVNEDQVKPPPAPLKSGIAIKSRMSCPGQFEIRPAKRNDLYPCLENFVPLNFAPPPTYSDSESLHNPKTVLPSAPSLNQIQSRKQPSIFEPANEALGRSQRSPNFEKSKQ